MIPSTTERVTLNTGLGLNEQVSRRIRDSVVEHAKGRPERLENRLAQLDQEWDTDRLMETGYAAVILGGVMLAVLDPWWLLLPGAAALFLLSHGVFGWDPFLPVYRQCGFRTSTEIDYERYALKGVRGDFQRITGFITPEDRDAIARMEGEGGPTCDGPTAPDASDPHVVQAMLEAAKK
jgi:hypothetical protein